MSKKRCAVRARRDFDDIMTTVYDNHTYVESDEDLTATSGAKSDDINSRQLVNNDKNMNMSPRDDLFATRVCLDNENEPNLSRQKMPETRKKKLPRLNTRSTSVDNERKNSTVQKKSIRRSMSEFLPSLSPSPVTSLSTHTSFDFPPRDENVNTSDNFASSEKKFKSLVTFVG